MLLGDIFEMWLERFLEVPPGNGERVDAWKSAGEVLIAAVHKLVSECGVQVYYVRGNHDHEITEQDIAQIFDNQVTFVPCTLILRLKLGEDNEQRVRLAHGHEWDIFNSYMLHRDGNLLPDRPIGYYIARAVATAGKGDSASELEDILINLASAILSFIPASLEDDLVESLEDKDYHRKLLSRLFEGAFNVDDIEAMVNSKCRVSDNKWIRLNTMLNYPLIRLAGCMVSL